MEKPDTVNPPGPRPFLWHLPPAKRKKARKKPIRAVSRVPKEVYSKWQRSKGRGERSRRAALRRFMRWERS